MSKKIDIFRIAQEAEVSIATVSRVINNYPLVKDSTKERVSKIIKKYQFYPNVHAKRLVQQKANNIGVIFPYNQHVFLDLYMTQLLDDLQDIINKYEYDLSIYFPKSNQNVSILKFFEESRVDGMIIGGVKLQDAQIEKLYEFRYKFVVIGSYAEKMTSNYVDIDNQAMVQEGIQYLYEKGHRKIGAIFDDTQFSAGRDRAKSFISEMKKKKLDTKYIVEFQSNIDIFEPITQLLRNKDRPTAIFAMSDLMAFKIYKAASFLNMKIPDDLSVLSVDDTIWTQTFLSPTLTSYHISTKKLADIAMSYLIKSILDSQVDFPPQLLKASLIERESVRKL